MQSISSLKRDRQNLSLSEVVNNWRQWLQEQDRSVGTVKKNLQATALFLEGMSRRNGCLYAIVQVLLQTGIRLSECSGLTLGDITFGERSGTLLVRAGKGNFVYIGSY